MRDDDILRRIELWATGATIHDVKGLIGLYRTFTAVLDSHKDHKDAELGRKLEICRADLAIVTKTMEEFMGHGDYRKARRDNPLTEEVTRVDFPWTRVQVGVGKFNYVLSRMPTQRVKIEAADGRGFNFGIQQTCLIARSPITKKIANLIELHYARWGQMPGWSKPLFDGMGGPELYDEWFQEKEKV